MDLDHIYRYREELLEMFQHPKNIKQGDILKYVFRVGRTQRKKRRGHQSYVMKGRRTLQVSSHPGAMDEGEVKDTVTVLLADLDYLEAIEKDRLSKVRIGGNGHVH